MMNSTTNELMSVKQLPIIVEQLHTIEAQIIDATKKVLSMECTTGTYKKIKEERAKITKQYEELETGRKAIKKAILQPYSDFESVYKKCVSDNYNSFKIKVDEKINAVEHTLLESKAKNVIDFFNEYAQACQIDFLTFEMTNIRINLTTTEKKLKEQAKEFVDNVVNDTALIKLQTPEQVPEIMFEYEKSLDVYGAITIVASRRQGLSEMQIKASKSIEYEPKEEIATENNNEVLDAPTEETTHQMSFTVRGTMEQLKSLKNYIIENNIEII